MTRPRRIASIFTNLHIGGDENRLLETARALDPARYELMVVLLVAPTPERDARYGPILQRYREAGIEVVDLGEPLRTERRRRGGRLANGLRDLVSFARITARLRALLREREIDVVDARMMYAVFFGALAGALAGTPVVVATEYYTKFWKPPLWWLLGQLAFRKCDAVISDSHDKLDELQRWLVGSHPRAVMIPNGIHTPETDRSSAEMRARFGLPADPAVRVVGQISRLRWYKGQRVLLDAAARVLERRPDTAFLICGYAHPDPAYKDELRARAEALGISKRVAIVSYPGPVGDVWAAIDVHAHATLLDSSPIAIHEAMALGRPSVVTRVGGIPELVEDGATGLVVEPDDPDAFAAALLRVLDDPDLAARLGAAARARFEARHRPEQMAAAHMDLYDELLDARAGARVPRPVRATPRRGGLES